MAVCTTIPATWQRAMDRATTDKLHAVRVNDRTFAVRSTSRRGYQHLVSLDDHFKIVACSDCPGFRGRQHPCKHAGAVAKRILRSR